MKAKISKLDASGDSVLVEYNTDSPAEVQVAQEALTKFLSDCVRQFGREPRVWGRRIGEKDTTVFETKKDRLIDCEEVLVSFPIAGG